MFLQERAIKSRERTQEPMYFPSAVAKTSLYLHILCTLSETIKIYYKSSGKLVTLPTLFAKESFHNLPTPGTHSSFPQNIATSHPESPKSRGKSDGPKYCASY